MLELELEIMLVGVGAEADFLDVDLYGVLSHLLGLLPLLVQILLVIQYLAYGRIGLGADFHQIQTKFISHFQSFGKGIDSLLRHIVTYQANLRGFDLLVDVQFILVLFILDAELA